MKHLAQTGSLVAAALALSATLNPGSASAAVLITGLDPAPTDPLTTATSLNAISVGSDTFSNLITPTQGQVDAALTVRGSADDPGFPSAADAVIDNDLTTGIGDIDDGVVRVLFGQTINDTNALADLFILDWGNAQDNAQNIRAIVGGTLAAPIYGGITLASATSPTRIGSTNGRYLSLDASTGSTNVLQDIGGFGLDLSDDLGVTSLIGIEFINTDHDTIGIYAVIPEPASLTLLALSGLCLLPRRRRA